MNLQVVIIYSPTYTVVSTMTALLFWNRNKCICYPYLSILYLIFSMYNPNTIKSYKISQKLSPKHAARGVAQSPYPIYRHGKACLSKQPPWPAAGDPPLARGRTQVEPWSSQARCAHFFSTLSSFLLWEIVFFAPSPPTPRKCWVKYQLVSPLVLSITFLCRYMALMIINI